MAFLYRFIFIFIVLSLTACHQSTGDIIADNSKDDVLKLKGEMQGVYAYVSKLYNYVFLEEELTSKKARKDLIKTIEEIEEGFHKIEEVSKNEQKEPGFRAAFLANKYLLNELKSDAKTASDEFIRWELRGLTANCSSCHTRSKVEKDFSGVIPQVKDKSAHMQIAVADFLIATRQFGKAEDYLIEILDSHQGVGDGSILFFQALKRYILVATRVKQQYRESADLLDNLLEQKELSNGSTSRIKYWSDSLKSISKPDVHAVFLPQNQKLDKAKQLLSPILNAERFDDDEMNFVNTLLATSLLHELLSSEISSEQLRESMLLLGQAYLHLPIETFSNYPEIYLTQCVKDYPKSKEAKIAYGLLEDRIKFLSTGSSGLNMTVEDTRKLRELRELAY